MTNDPNFYKSDIKSHRYAINQLQKNLDQRQNIIDELQSNNMSMQEELNLILNSRGWLLLEKARKLLSYLPKTHKNSKNNSKVPSFKSTYNSHYEDNVDYAKKGYTPEVKALAFYLPQFHTFKENDNWWGKGFTEWTNTKKAIPRFDGHYQPREPHDDIGYYTLDNIDTIKKQISLAKQHGIYGFCFYYYWFSGKRLMEKPIDIFLKNKDVSFPFCLCWANENWTRTWDGLNKNILIEQKYLKNDPKKFILDLKKYLLDPRYIRINGKPVVLVYAPNSIPNFEEVVSQWRKTAKEIGIGDILIWSKNTIFDHDFSNAEFVDGEFDFAPTGCSFAGLQLEHSPTRSILNYSGMVQDCEDHKKYYNHFPIKPFYYSCTLGWDNSSRRKTGYSVLSEYSPEKFYKWLRLIIDETKRRQPPEQRFIFINAWNEWAEGAYLEPDKKYGYTNINTASKAIYGLPYADQDAVVLDKNSKINKNIQKIAIQIHAFYIDVLPELLGYLSKIPYQFDLYISTNTQTKKHFIQNEIKKYNLKYKKIKIDVLENVGRDVYPFLKQLSKTYKQYNIIGHFHTKKTIHQFYGDMWRNHIYSNILGSSNNASRLLTLFDDAEIGIVMPTCFPLVRAGLNLGINTNTVNSLLNKLNLPNVDKNTKITFPAGTMFWARTQSIKEIFELKLDVDDFPDEQGQLDGTIAHSVERLLGIIPKLKGYKVIEVINKGEDE